jgi:glyoxylase I family protein
MPIPGLTRVDYTGITVPDLDQGREYLEVALGVEYPYRLGPLWDNEGHGMSEDLNGHGRVVSPRVFVFRTGGQALLEVFEAFLRNPQAPR